MGRFYSWKYIFKHLAHFDFFHVAIGLYGKKAVKRALDEAMDYTLDFPECQVKSADFHIFCKSQNSTCPRV